MQWGKPGAIQNIDTGGELVYNGVKAASKSELIPADLMDELANSGVKYTREDVIMVTKNSDGKLMWLEQGNESAGLTHILERHEKDFEVTEDAAEEITQNLKKVLNTDYIKTSGDSARPITIYHYDGKYYLVSHGTNGFIQTFYPINDKYANKLLQKME